MLIKAYTATYYQKMKYSRILRKHSPNGILTCPFCKEPITDEELERSKEYEKVLEIEESNPLVGDLDEYQEYTSEINLLEWHPLNITVCHGDCADFLPDTDRGRRMLQRYLFMIYGEPAKEFHEFCVDFGKLGLFEFPHYKKSYETEMRDQVLKYLSEMEHFD